MKQQVNPIVMVVCIALAVIVAIFCGMKAMNPPAPVERTHTADKPAEINGHRVPGNVPFDYMNKGINQGGGGNRPNGYAPNQMPGSGQMPQHP